MTTKKVLKMLDDATVKLLVEESEAQGSVNANVVKSVRNRCAETAPSDNLHLGTNEENAQIDKMVMRKYFNNNISDLEGVFQKHVLDPEELSELKAELQCRKSFRAKQLLGRVTRALSAINERNENGNCETDKSSEAENIEITDGSSFEKFGKSRDCQEDRASLSKSPLMSDLFEADTMQHPLDLAPFSIADGADQKTDLVEHVLANDPSVRLANALTFAREHGLLPVSTLEGYRELPYNKRIEFKGVKNLGTKCFNELELIASSKSSAKQIHMDFLSQCDDDMSLFDFVSKMHGSVRLLNALALASRTDSLPAKTIGEFYSLNVGEREKFFHLRNFGRTSFDELNRLLEGYCLEKDAEKRARFARLYRALENIDLFDVLESSFVSVRLHNLIENNRESLKDEERSLSAALQSRVHVKAALQRLPNAGRKTIAEYFDKAERLFDHLLLRAGLGEGLRHKLLPSPNAAKLSELNASEINEISVALEVAELKGQMNPILLAQELEFGLRFPQQIVSSPKKTLTSIMRRVLDEKELNIVCRRFGLDGLSAETLESVSKSYSVTRERIRQLEAKSIKKLERQVTKNAFGIYLDAYTNEIWNQLSGSGRLLTTSMLEGWQRKLGGLSRLAISICHSDLPSYLNAVYRKVAVANGDRVWVAPDMPIDDVLELIEQVVQGNTLDKSMAQQLKSLIADECWPISLQSLHQKMPQHNIEAIQHELTTSFGAVIDDGVVVSIGKLPTSTRLVLVLREAGRALELAEIAARHNTLFKAQISVHSVSACLQRLPEVLIVARGKYNLYENFALTHEEIEEVKNVAEGIIRTKGSYVSTKLIFKDALAKLSTDISDLLTPYSVLGICQDDERFDCRRGLMIGLNDPDFQGDFQQLDDTVAKIVRRDGPIAVPEIRRQISDVREVNDTSILNSLLANREIVSPARGMFDFVENVIGDEEVIHRLKLAIKIALMKNPVSLQTLSVRLSSVGYRLELPTILTFSQHCTFVDRDGQHFSLKGTDAGLDDYDTAFQAYFADTTNQKLDREVFARDYCDEAQRELSKIDFRFSLSPAEWNNQRSDDTNEEDLITEILQEFA